MERRKIMPTRLLDTTEANIGGIVTLITGGLVQLYEYVTMENINDFLELGLAVGGGLFLFFKIKGQILDNESKRLDNEKKKNDR